MGNTFPDKSGNPESLKSLKISTTVATAGEHLLRRYTGCFIYSFVI